MKSSSDASSLQIEQTVVSSVASSDGAQSSQQSPQIITETQKLAAAAAVLSLHLDEILASWSGLIASSTLVLSSGSQPLSMAMETDRDAGQADAEVAATAACELKPWLLPSHGLSNDQGSSLSADAPSPAASNASDRTAASAVFAAFRASMLVYPVAIALNALLGQNGRDPESRDAIVATWARAVLGRCQAMMPQISTATLDGSNGKRTV